MWPRLISRGWVDVVAVCFGHHAASMWPRLICRGRRLQQRGSDPPTSDLPPRSVPLRPAAHPAQPNCQGAHRSLFNDRGK
jgi:hypothetical protein